MVPRVEQQIVRLFDQLKEEKVDKDETKPFDQKEASLLEQARLQLDAIRALYLEQMFAFSETIKHEILSVKAWKAVDASGFLQKEWWNHWPIQPGPWSN